MVEPFTLLAAGSQASKGLAGSGKDSSAGDAKTGDIFFDPQFGNISTGTDTTQLIIVGSIVLLLAGIIVLAKKK